jgi:CrcB protein
LLLGALFQFSENWAAMAESPISPKLMLALRVGFLGSLTTFSTLVGDVSVLGTTDRIDASLVLLGVNLLGGIVLFLTAMAVVRGVMS